MISRLSKLTLRSTRPLFHWQFSAHVRYALKNLGIATCMFVIIHSVDAATVRAQPNDRPNVVLIMTDDQGWGDFGFHDNPAIRTPHMDAMAGRSVRFTNFYVSPVCSPTRASLMTGRYNYRTRCIDTYLGRTMMEPDEVTIAEVLRSAGYRTGIFGKWHLGDCYPMRPMDQGFEVSVVHRGGGLAQPSDPLENNRRYTDPILFRNGNAFQAKGYCTDVYFENAQQFIRDSVQQSKPFFAYIATNAPHGPRHDVPNDLKEQYLDSPAQLDQLPVGNVDRPEEMREQLAATAAMITNIDENLGRLFEMLDQLAVREQTLVMFLVDNGPDSPRFVGDFRGRKSQVFEGGVRSPLWLDWPSELASDSERTPLAAHIDVFPTILEACRVPVPDQVKLDGRSLLPSARNANVEWPDRTLVIQSHRGDVPQRFHHFMLRQGPWKLVNPTGFGRKTLPDDDQLQLYHLEQDPGESTNLAADHPEKVTALKQQYTRWFNDVSSTRSNNYEPPRIVIGTEFETETVLNRNEWRADNWNDETVGTWKTRIAQPDQYHFEVIFRTSSSGKVHLQVGPQHRVMDVVETDRALLEMKLPSGPAEIRAWRTSANDPQQKGGAYHVKVSKASSGGSR